MFFDVRWFVVFSVNLMGMVLLGVLNDGTAWLSLYACVMGPMLVVPAFYLGVRSSVVCALLTAFMWEAGHPVALGYAVVPWVMLNAILLLTRGRFVREHTFQLLVLSVVLNGLWCLYMGITLADDAWSWTYVWRVLTDWVYSQGVCLMLAWWINAMVKALLQKFNLGLMPREYAA